jgi:hypothetical protein
LFGASIARFGCEPTTGVGSASVGPPNLIAASQMIVPAIRLVGEYGFLLGARPSLQLSVDGTGVKGYDSARFL